MLTELEKEKVSVWLKSQGNVPEKPFEAIVESQGFKQANNDFLPIGRYTLEVSDPDLKKILDSWAADQSHGTQKAIFLGEHYACFAHTVVDKTKIMMFATYRE